jgi:AraC-like DNA-binding protein
MRLQQGPDEYVPQEIAPYVASAEAGSVTVLHSRAVLGHPMSIDDYGFVLPPLVSDALFITEARAFAFDGKAPPAVVPLNPGQPFGGDRTGPATPYFFVVVDRNYLERIALETFDLGCLRFEPGAFPLRGDVHADVRRLHDESRVGTPDCRLVMDSLASVIAVCLLRSTVRPKGSDVLFRSRHPGIERARRLIEANLDAPLTVKFLAARAFLSESQFNVLFKRHHGMTPHEYLRRARIAAARQRLEHGEDVTRTCFAVGFTSMSGFEEAFRQLVKMSPTQYRRHVRT